MPDMADTTKPDVKPRSGPRTRRPKPEAASDPDAVAAPPPPPAPTSAQPDLPFGHGILDEIQAEATRAPEPAAMPEVPAAEAPAEPAAPEEPASDRPAANVQAPAAQQGQTSYRRRVFGDEEGPRGFDEETNSRYEEIKRGSTY